MDEDVKVRHYAMIGALDALGIPHDNGWLDAQVRHLRLVPNWANQEFVDSLKHLKKSLKCKLENILRFTPACHRTWITSL